MPAYLLDTDICIYFLQGKYNIGDHIQAVGPNQCFISEISLLELMYGASKSTKTTKSMAQVKQVESLFQSIPIFPCFPLFAKEKVRLQKEGNLIPDFDLLIGCSAIAHEMIMVTNNVKHLERISDIKLENWVGNTNTSNSSVPV
ncbi:MAG: type II toxin-antitoxin system VapC family toxin [Bacteroidota bacterium]